MITNRPDEGHLPAEQISDGFGLCMWQFPGRYLPLKSVIQGGAWVALSVKRPTSARVMVPRSVSSSPWTGSVLPAWNRLWILCFPVSLCRSPHSRSPPPSSKTNKHENKTNKSFHCEFGEEGQNVGDPNHISSPLVLLFLPVAKNHVLGKTNTCLILHLDSWGQNQLYFPRSAQP